MTRRTERMLLTTAALAVILAVAGWRGADAAADWRPAAPNGSPNDSVSLTTPGERAATASLASDIVARNPFRLDRRPSSVPFGAPPVVAAPPDPTRRPKIQLTGVFGPPWQAVLEGIPGREGSVVARVGDAFGTLRIRSIRRDTVVVQGADTTWKLTVRHVW